MVHLEIGAALLAHLHEEVRVLVEVGGCLDLEVLVRDVVLRAEEEVQSVRGLLAGHLHGLDHVGRGGVDPGHDLVVAGGVGHIAGDGVVVGAELEVATDVSAVEPLGNLRDDGADGVVVAVVVLDADVQVVTRRRRDRRRCTFPG